jgi:chaperonin cofactor prefoldin
MSQAANATTAAKSAAAAGAQPKRELTAMQQTELIEKQKIVQERERKIQGLKRQRQAVLQRGMTTARERTRCRITSAELAKYEPAHTVYRAIGRMFVKMTVPKMTDDIKAVETDCDRELAKCEEDRQRVDSAIQSEEALLVQDHNEFVNLLVRYGLAVRQQPQA